jgi:hypothetical protein
VAEDLLADEDEPVQALGDSAYGTASLREHLEAAGHEAIFKPPPLQPAVPGGFTSGDFLIDWESEQVTCPTGHTRPLGKPTKAGYRQAQFKPRCTDCPLLERCTTSKAGRVLTMHPQYRQLADARAAAAAPAWQHKYRTWRPLVERGIAWLTHGTRRLRYRGTVKNDAWLHLRAAALNLRRLINLGLDHRNGTWTITAATT